MVSTSGLWDVFIPSLDDSPALPSLRPLVAGFETCRQTVSCKEKHRLPLGWVVGMDLEKAFPERRAAQGSLG